MTQATIVKACKLWLEIAVGVALFVGYFVASFIYLRAAGML
jgi:hypothetical protein